MRKPLYLRTLRERRGLTQQQLAERSGVPQNTISTLERVPGTTTRYAHHIALAQALGVDAARLAFGPDPDQIATEAAS